MRTHGIPIALARSGGRILDISTEERMFNELNETLRTNFTQQRERADNLEAALEAVQAQINGGAGAVGLTGSPLPVDPSYTSAFASYFRRGDGEDVLKVANATGDRAIVQNAMSVGTNTDGGYLAPVEWDRKLQERQRATSPMRRLATVRTTTVGAYSTLWNLDQWGSGWVGETAARPNTTATSLAPIIFAAGEIYAMPAATQRLLDDAVLNVENWLAESVEREFNRQEGIAFLSGDGSNKPAGFLTYVDGGGNENTHPGGALEVVEADIDLDALTDFLYGLGSAYRQNATWLMSSLTAAFIAKIKDADGRPIWRESLIVGQPAPLLGRPVEIDEGMPAPTAGNLAIAFGDFRAGYLINDRIGTRVLRDPYTNKPYVNFYVTKRVGGGLLDPFAIRLLRVAA